MTSSRVQSNWRDAAESGRQWQQASRGRGHPARCRTGYSVPEQATDDGRRLVGGDGCVLGKCHRGRMRRPPGCRCRSGRGDLRSADDVLLGGPGVREGLPGRLRLRQTHPSTADSTVTMLTQVSQLVNIWPTVYCQVRLTGIEIGNSLVKICPPGIFTAISAVRSKLEFGCVGCTNHVHSSAVCSPIDLSIASLGITDASSGSARSWTPMVDPTLTLPAGAE